MNINELIHETEAEELSALSQFFVGRANNQGIPGSMSVEEFSELARALGMSVDSTTLQQMVTSGQVGGIEDVSDEEVRFDSSEKVDQEVMSQKKAEMTMQNSAKRAMNARK